MESFTGIFGFECNENTNQIASYNQIKKYSSKLFRMVFAFSILPTKKNVKRNK